jgi:hypothetical protein
VWRNFASYLRTANTNKASEWVVAMALCNTWHDFLRLSPNTFPLKKFLGLRIDGTRSRNHDAFELERAV